MKRYDAIVIGSGQGGTALARKLAERGERVLLAERHRLGGSCVNHGCTPSKALLAAVRVLGVARAADTLGIEAEARPDFSAVMARVREVRDQWRSGIEKVREVENLDVVDGEARFTAPKTVAVGDETFTAERIVINTGTSPARPPIEGLDGVSTLTNQTFFDLETLPERTLVLGGGYIGLELGQALARLGSRVEVVDRNGRPLARESEELGETLREALEGDGMSFHFGESIRSAVRRGGDVVVHLESGGKLRGDILFLAAGRTPNTEALDTGKAGIELDDRGHVEIDERFATSAEGVWAIGDCAGQPAFTHVSWEDHLRLLDVWEGGERHRSDRTLAYAVFTDPQVGRVGLSVEQAREAGHEVVVKRQDVGKIARAVEWNQLEGFQELVVDRKTQKLLGATFVGYEASELAQIVLPTVERGGTWHELAEPVFAHPTYGEGLGTLARSLAEDFRD